jgi:hypothetical protein
VTIAIVPLGTPRLHLWMHDGCVSHGLFERHGITSVVAKADLVRFCWLQGSNTDKQRLDARRVAPAALARSARA